MTRRTTMICFLTASFLLQAYSEGQTLNFSLDGSAGPGILSESEPDPDVINGGTGGIGPNGISFDLESGVLSVDVLWGSENGFTDLSSDIDFMNIHGPTSQHAPENYFESAETYTGLNGFNPSASSGGYAGDTTFETSDYAKLFEGRYYIHLHTFDNGGGEARGYFVPDVVVGDVNGDGRIDLLDINPFVEAISSSGFIDEADINRDGVVNLLDVNPMITLLGG